MKKRTLKLINNECISKKLVSAKACSSGASDICVEEDNKSCALYSYDYCGKDYAACTNYSYDYCEVEDYTACSNKGYDIEL